MKRFTLVIVVLVAVIFVIYSLQTTATEDKPINPSTSQTSQGSSSHPSNKVQKTTLPPSQNTSTSQQKPDTSQTTKTVLELRDSSGEAVQSSTTVSLRGPADKKDSTGVTQDLSKAIESQIETGKGTIDSGQIRTKNKESGKEILEQESPEQEKQTSEGVLTIRVPLNQDTPSAALSTGDFIISSGTVDYSIPDLGYRWVSLWTTSTLPPDAQVTNLEYRLRIDDTGDPSTFYCGDYEIYLSSETNGGPNRYLLVYDNLGGRTDGGYDDDTEDDSDIYLNWRSTSQFNGEDPAQPWCVWIDDVYSADYGELEYIEFHVYWQTPEKPDLTCPWISWQATEVNCGDPFWIRPKIQNNGLATAGASHARLYLSLDNDFDVSDDYEVLPKKSVPSLSPGSYDDVQWDIDPFPDLGSGDYWVWMVVVVDCDDEVDESNENNTYKSLDSILVHCEIQKPDLTCPWISWQAAEVNEGDSFWIRPKILNDGDAAAGASHARLYLSTDNDFDPNNGDEPLEVKSVSSLSEGAYDEVQWNIASFPDLGSGDYNVWVVVVVDYYDAVDESNENNIYKGNDPFLVHDGDVQDINVFPIELTINQTETISRDHIWIDYVAPSDSLTLQNQVNEKHQLGLIVPDSVREYWLSNTPQLQYDVKNFLASIDWSSDDSPVKSQGGCGSCWAFAAVGLIENLGYQTDLSEQTIVSCAPGDCGGGWYWDALAYAKSDGIPPEDCYPYIAANGNCADKCTNPSFLEKVTSHTLATGLWGEPATVNDIKAALQNGPLNVAMRVPTDNTFNPGYQSGIYDYNGGFIPWAGNGHAVLVVGYNDDQQCFKVKNSWGNGWGENGYFRIAYDDVTDDVMFGSYGVTATVGQEDIFTIQNVGNGTLSINNITDDRNWISTSEHPALPFNISTGGSQTVTVNVDWSQLGGTSTGQITVFSNDPDEPSVTVDVTAIPSTVSLILTSPNGGEDWCVGSSHNITWICEGIDNVKIDYSTNGGGSWIPITPSTPCGNGSYPWTIPDTPSSNCIVRICDAADNDPCDTSDDVFTISAQTISVIAPNGGESWCRDSCYTILWNSNCIDMVRIDYSTNAGSSWNTIVPSTNSDGNHEWCIPDTPSDNCLVRICDASDSDPCGVSNNYFTIEVCDIPDFTLDVTPENQEVNCGDSITYNVSLNPVFGFDSTVTLGVPAGLPPGASHHFDPPSLTPPGTSILTIQTVDPTNPDTYYSLVEGTGGGKTHNDTISLVVTCTTCVDPEHFVFKENTGESYSIVVDSALCAELELEECDEVGVFDGDLCVGASVYHPDDLPLALVAWQDDPQTPDTVDGYICGHPISFRLWKRSDEVESPCYPHYSTGDGTFCYGAYSRLWLDCSCEPCQNIALYSGWQWISSYIDPEFPEIESVFADCWSCLGIVVACDGSFCIPGVGCWIDSFNVFEMYKVHMSCPCSLKVCGDRVPVNTPIALSSGWGCVSYLPDCPLEPDFALASIWSCLDIVKNDGGEFCIPGVICTIDCMEPGEGYKVHMACADNLIYPTSCPPCPSPHAKQTPYSEVLIPTHFNFIRNTGESYSIVINSIDLSGKTPEMGDEIGIFTSSGLCVGGGVWHGRVVGISAWADDEQTEVVDGFRAREKMLFKLWDNSENTEIELVTTYDQANGLFGEGAYASVRLKASQDVIPGGLEITQNYPNPFNPVTQISFTLPQSARVTLIVYNLLGQKVKTLVEQDMQAGRHEIVWDGTDEKGEPVSTGIYFYRLQTGEYSISRKMVILK